MLSLSQAMLWFHEACREPLDLMAILNCAVALDALASGGRARGICELICARLGIGPDDACIGARTPRELVHQIYERTRNPAAHGRESPFGRDWSRTRALAETITRRMIIECLNWANAHLPCGRPCRPGSPPACPGRDSRADLKAQTRLLTRSDRGRRYLHLPRPSDVRLRRDSHLHPRRSRERHLIRAAA